MHGIHPSPASTSRIHITHHNQPNGAMKTSIYGRFVAMLIGGYVAINAIAAIPVTPGNVPQKKCGTSRVDSLVRMGTVARAGTVFSVADRRLNLGKPLAVGEVLFYASLTEGTKVYRTEKQIEIIDDSPLTPDIKVTPQDQMSLLGTFLSSKGQKFDLIVLGSSFSKVVAMVDDSGFICSDRLDEKLVAVGAPTTYQETPLKAVIIESCVGKSRTVSVAVTYMGLVGATASFQVAVMVNGQVESTKVSSFDVYAPQVNIGDLNFAMKVEEGRMVVTSLNEPDDYSAWLMSIRKRR